MSKLSFKETKKKAKKNRSRALESYDMPIESNEKATDALYNKGSELYQLDRLYEALEWDQKAQIAYYYSDSVVILVITDARITALKDDEWMLTEWLKAFQFGNPL